MNVLPSRNVKAFFLFAGKMGMFFAGKAGMFIFLKDGEVFLPGRRGVYFFEIWGCFLPGRREE